MNQSQLISQFNEKYREKFNPYFFQRDEDAIAQKIMNVILSSQRDKTYTIKVKHWEIVEDYATIYKYLKQYEESSPNKKRRKDNKYDFIDMKDSDIRLLIVDYYLKIKDEEDNMRVYIMIPRIVNKYYMKINGNLYSTIYQLVDASTYNNRTSNNVKKNQVVTFKSIFMPVIISAKKVTLMDINKQEVECTHYTGTIFSKTVPVFKYILGAKGLAGTMKFFNISGIYFLDRVPTEYDSEKYYIFNSKRIYIVVSKVLMENDVIQSFVYAVYHSIMKQTTLKSLLSQNFWYEALSKEFIQNAFIDKAISVLDSLEHIYDISTKESLHLPEEDKVDIYCILKWMMTNFNKLYMKDNLDVVIKRIRFEDYIAAIYAAKLSPGIYRISDLGQKADIKALRRAVNIRPNYLLTSITKQKFINYRNMVNDMDSIIAIKYTYKGISGIGEKTNQVSQIYRNVDISHIGRIDPDTSSNSDPGLTGSLCPLTKLYDNSFEPYEEPNEWNDKVKELYKGLREQTGLKEVVIASKELLNNDVDSEKLSEIEDNITMAKRLITPIGRIEHPSNYMINCYDMFGDGMFYVSWE